MLLIHHPRAFVLLLVQVCNGSLAMLAAFLEGADVVTAIVPNLIAEAFDERVAKLACVGFLQICEVIRALPV